MRVELIKAIAAALDADLTSKVRMLPEYGAPQPKPAAQVLSDPKVQKFLDAVTRDLLANVGKSLIVAGPDLPPEVHALVHRLNAALGNVGRTVLYSEDTTASDKSDVLALKELVDGIGSIGSRCTFVALEYREMRAVPGSTTYRTPGTVSEVSATFVARMTRRCVVVVKTLL